MADSFHIPIITNDGKVPDGSNGILSTVGIGTQEGGTSVASTVYLNDFSPNISDIAILNQVGSGKVVKIYRCCLTDLNFNQAQLGIANPVRLQICTAYTGGKLSSNTFIKLDSASPDIPSGIDMFTDITSVTGTTLRRSHHQIIYSSIRSITSFSIRPAGMSSPNGNGHNVTTLYGGNDESNATPIILNPNQGLSFECIKPSTTRSMGSGNISILLSVNGYSYISKCYISTTNYTDLEFLIYNSSADQVHIKQIDYVPVFGTTKSTNGISSTPAWWPRMIHHVYQYSDQLALDPSKEDQAIPLDTSISLPSGIKVYRNGIAAYNRASGSYDVNISTLTGLRGQRKSQISAIPSVNLGTVGEAMFANSTRIRLDYQNAPIIVNPGEVFVMTEMHISVNTASIAGGDSDQEGSILFTVEDQPVAPTTSAEYGSSY